MQALIAARLDSLDASDVRCCRRLGGRRPLLAGGAPRPRPPRRSRRFAPRAPATGLIRRSPLSTIANETEFAFTHGLIRDVAYGRLPGPPAPDAPGVTEWLEATAGDRVSERADLLASHAVRALDLARAAGLDRGDARTRGRRAAVPGDGRRAPDGPGRRAGPPSTTPGRPSSRPPTGHERAELLRHATSLGWRSGAMTSDEAVAAYRECVATRARRGRPRDRGASACGGSTSSWACRAKTEAAATSLDQAIELLEAADGPGPVLAELYACRSEAEMFAGRSAGLARWAERALELPRTPR